MMRTHSRLRNRNGYAFSPLSLFAAGEQGVWYDPNDLSTLFQDSAGTIPVTAAGQPVGRMLDKSGRGNHAIQPAAASRPTLRLNSTTGAYYLETDGIDDFMLTSSIDLTATDEISVITGIRKLSDATIGIVCELSADLNANNGAFYMAAPSQSGIANSSFASKGTQQAAAAAAGFASPVSAVLSGFGNISAPLVTHRRNGVVVSQVASTQGAGNYGSHSVYLFRRGGVSLPFTGHFYGLIIVARLTTSTETRGAELALAQRTGVVLA